MSSNIIDTDPQMIGSKPLTPKPYSEDADKTANLLKQFIDQAREILANQNPANMLLFRGFSKKPDWPSMEDIYGLKSAAIAAYPMYRGLAKLLGMSVLETGQTVEDEFNPEWELEGMKQTIKYALLLVDRINKTQSPPKLKSDLPFPVEE